LKLDTIYEEIPFEIKNSPLDQSLVHEYESEISKKQEVNV